MERAVAEEGEEEEALAAAEEAGDAGNQSITTIMAERWYGEARVSESDPANSSSWLAGLPTPTLPCLPSMGLSKRSASAAPWSQAASSHCIALWVQPRGTQGRAVADCALTHHLRPSARHLAPVFTPALPSRPLPLPTHTHRPLHNTHHQPPSPPPLPQQVLWLPGRFRAPISPAPPQLPLAPGTCLTPPYPPAPH
jgi:hypothetical protein